MKYDPIKKTLGKVFNDRPFLRITFYKLLDLLLLRAWYVKRELKKWAKTAGNDINILDAGAGFGQYVYFMAKLNKNWKITGVDLKTEQIEDSNKFFTKIKLDDRVNFKYADLTEYVEENSYDFILTIDVMEHIEDDVKVFENFHKSLKDNGWLLITTPSDKGGSDVHDHDEESFIDEHVRDGYNIDEIKEKLKKAGFSKIEAKYTYGKPGNLSWKLSMKYPIIMLNVSKLFFVILPFYYLFTYPVSYLLNFIDTRTQHNEGTGLLVKAWK